MAGLHGMDWLVDGPAADRLVGYHPDITSNERALLKPHRDLRDGFTGVLPHPPVELVFLLRLDLPPRRRAPLRQRHGDRDGHQEDHDAAEAEQLEVVVQPAHRLPERAGAQPRRQLRRELAEREGGAHLGRVRVRVRVTVTVSVRVGWP